MTTKQAKAQILFDEDSVQQVNSDTFVVHGSSNNQYEIKANQDKLYNYKYYCKCPAWKFDNSRECKHVLAVKLYENAKSTKGNYRIKPKLAAKLRQSNKAKQYIVKVNPDRIIDNKGKDGKDKPLKFDKDGKLIIQYTDEVEAVKQSRYDDE